jgi:hypothetical protein
MKTLRVNEVAVVAIVDGQFRRYAPGGVGRWPKWGNKSSPRAGVEGLLCDQIETVGAPGGHGLAPLPAIRGTKGVKL